MSIEFRYRSINPYYVSDQKDVIWNIAKDNGISNIRFNNTIIVTADISSIPLHAISFVRITNRERKIIIATDIGHVKHNNESVDSQDDLSIKNQEGSSWETFNKPPSTIIPIIPVIENWKKITSNSYGRLDRQFSPVGYPDASRSDMRVMRLNHGSFRVSNSYNPNGYAIKYGTELFNYIENAGTRCCILRGTGPVSDNFNFLIMPPDMDYPEGSQLFPNYTFDDTYEVTIGVSQKFWPTGLSIAGPLNVLSQTTNNTPYIEDETFSYFGSHVEKVVKIPANELTEVFPGMSDPSASFYNFVGIYKKFEGTAPGLRSNESRYRHRIAKGYPDYDDMTSWTGVTVVNTNSGVDSLSFFGDDDYFSDIEYSAISDDDYTRWQTDNGTSQSIWSVFNADGTSQYNTSSLIRHYFDESQKYVSAKYDLRRTQGAEDSSAGYFKWLDWEDDLNYSVDYYNSTKEVSPVFYQRLQSATMRGNQKFIVELGRKGSRGRAYKLKFNKNSESFSIDITVGNAINRLVYKGDILKYEVLVDKTSVDKKIYVDLEYYDSGQTGNTSYMSGLVSTFDSEWTEKDNYWNKVHIDIPSAMYGKYIKHIHFVSSESSAVNGNCLFYINEVQILNVIDLFNGRQFLSAMNFRRRSWMNTTRPQDVNMSIFSYPFITLIGSIVDGNGDPVKNEYSTSFIDNGQDSPNYYPYDYESNSAGYDDKTKWKVSHHSVEFNNFLQDVIIFIGCYKTEEYESGKWRGPNLGSILEVERFCLYPTSDLHFVVSYSTDNWTGGDIEDTYDTFIDYDELAWKAWALEVSGKYFDVD